MPAPGYPGSTLGVNPRGHGVIPRRFKRKKVLVTEPRTDGPTDGHADRRARPNSDVDEIQ